MPSCRLLACVVVLHGCSDYGLVKHPGEPGWGEPEDPPAPEIPPEYDFAPPEGAPGPDPEPVLTIPDPPELAGPGPRPDIAADPWRVDTAGFCAADEREIAVWNRGDGPLTITAVEVVGSGWTTPPVATPFVLAPAERVTFPVSTTGGDAALHLRSDDPDEPLLVVPLSGAPNQPPTARVLDPADGIVVDEGGDLHVVGLVADDHDPVESLDVSWASSADGPLRGDVPGMDGSVRLDWPAASRTPGIQTVTLTATDSCGATATDTVSLCQDASRTYDALDLTGWQFEGMAHYDRSHGWLVLTDATEFQVGTAFETSSPVDAGDVTLEFMFFIGGGTGADGISVTALDVDRMTTFLGGDGCGIGYGGDASCTDGPALPGWSIEVDTWYNSGHDPTRDDHVAVTIDGDVDDPEVLVELPEMEDNGWHTMRVDVVAPWITVAIDGVVYIDEEIDGIGSFPAYVGFTAGTGGATNWHVIDALEITERVCE